MDVIKKFTGRRVLAAVVAAVVLIASIVPQLITSAQEEADSKKADVSLRLFGISGTVTVSAGNETKGVYRVSEREGARIYEKQDDKGEFVMLKAGADGTVDVFREEDLVFSAAAQDGHHIGTFRMTDESNEELEGQMDRTGREDSYDMEWKADGDAAYVDVVFEETQPEGHDALTYPKSQYRSLERLAMEKGVEDVPARMKEAGLDEAAYPQNDFGANYVAFVEAYGLGTTMAEVKEAAGEELPVDATFAFPGGGESFTVLPGGDAGTGTGHQGFNIQLDGFPAGTTAGAGYCLTHGAANPNPGDVYTGLTITHQGGNTYAIGSYTRNGEACATDGVLGYQGVGVTITIAPQDGSLDLQKRSANPSLTDGNRCYSLEGAQYSVTPVGDGTSGKTLVTDANGYAKVDGLKPGQYYVKETHAPQGYKLDNRTYTVEVAGNETRRVNGGYVEDEPGDDPGRLILKKDSYDRKVTNEKPVGNGNLGGAKYSLKFYPSPDATGSCREWYLETNSKGVIDLLIPQKFLTADSPSKEEDFFKNNDFITWPLGTLVMKELSAPAGYLQDPAEYVGHVVADPTHPAGAKFTWEESDGVDVTIDRGVENSVFHWEKSVKGGIAVTKYDADGGTTPQGNCKLEGTKFAVYNVSANEVLSLDKKTMIPPVSVADAHAGKKAGIVGVIVCDKNAVASTGKKVLSYGDYVLLETEAGEGYMNSGWSSDVIEIRTDGQYVEIK